jgi:hypothetical protein
MTQKSRKPWKSENITRVTFSDRRKILLITLLGCFPVESSTGCREKHSWGNHPVTSSYNLVFFFILLGISPVNKNKDQGKNQVSFQNNPVRFLPSLQCRDEEWEK